MSIVGSLLLFGAFILAYAIIVEVFTVLFRLTGLTEEKARLQVISMLTTSGFTTTESEMVVNSKRRRKLTRITILFGYSFNVIIVSIIVNVFLALNSTELKYALEATILLVVLAVPVYLLTRLKGVRDRFDHLIEKLGNRMMFGKGSNTMVLIDTYGGNVMAEIHLEHLPKTLIDVRLADSGLKERYGIQLLLIKRSERPLERINGDTILHKRDMVVVFGVYKNIRALFEHPDGIAAPDGSGR